MTGKRVVLRLTPLLDLLMILVFLFMQYVRKADADAISTLKKQNRDLTQKVKLLSNQQTVLEKQLKEATTELEKAEGIVNFVKTKNGQLEQQLAYANRQIGVLNRQVAEAKEETKEANKEKREAQQQAQQAAAAAQEARERAQKAEREREKAKQERDEWKEQYEQLAKEHKELKEMTDAPPDWRELRRNIKVLHGYVDHWRFDMDNKGRIHWKLFNNESKGVLQPPVTVGPCVQDILKVINNKGQPKSIVILEYSIDRNAIAQHTRPFERAIHQVADKLSEAKSVQAVAREVKSREVK